MKSTLSPLLTWRKQHTSLIRWILWSILTLTVVWIIYLFIPVEVFPLGAWEISDQYGDEINITYNPQTWSEHISFQQEYQTDAWILRYLDIGDKNDPVIVLLHGTPTSSWMYRHVIRDLSQNWWRVIAPDMLWYGNSDKPSEREHYSIDLQSKRLVWLLDSLDIQTWTHVTHDIGWLWTWELLRDGYTDRIDHLLIMNTVWFNEGFHPPGIMKSFPWAGQAFTKLITIDPLSRMIMTQTITMMLNNTALVSRDMVDGYLYPTMQWQWRVYWYFLSELPEVITYLEETKKWFASHMDELPSASLVRGAQDVNLSVDQIPYFQEYFAIDDQDILIWEDASHLVAEEKWEDLVAHIMSKKQ